MPPANLDRVLMIGWEYPPHNSGGLGVACQGLSQALAGDQTEIFFTLPYASGGMIKHMKVVDCFDPAWDQPEDKPPFSAYHSVSPKIPIKQIDSHQLRDLPQSEIEHKVEEYGRLVEQKAVELADQFEVIHAHDWMSFPAAIKVKKKTNKPLVVHVHSTEEDRIPTGYGSQYIKATEKAGMDAADKVVAVSFYTKRLLVSKYQIPADKIEVVHNGVNPLTYQPNLGRHHFASKRPIISFMGRLTMQKGAEFFVDVARRVTSQRPEALFVLAGSGDMYHELLLRSAHQELTASVLFSGFVRGHQKRKLLERSDIFVMPSVSEPFGLVALEAAQHHTPVIVSKNSGVSELLSDAISLDFWDVDQMSQAIMNLLDDQGHYQQQVSSQLDALNQATWQNAAQKMKQVYRRVFLG